MKKLNKLLCLLLTVAMIIGTGALNGSFAQTASAAVSFELIYGSTLSIDTATGTLRNLIPGISIGTVKGNFKSDVTVYDASGAVVDDSDTIGTGYTVKADDGSALTAVVFGDITGDGVFSTPDFIALKSYLKGAISLTGAYFYAADVTQDDTVSTTDTIAVKGGLSGSNDMFASFYCKAFVLTSAVPKYASAVDAAAGTASTGVAGAGTYYVHKSYPAGLDGMYCLTATAYATDAGFWIDPSAIGATEDSSEDDSSEAVDSSEDDSSEDESSDVVTAETYVVIKEINKYTSSTSAAAQTNAAGTVAPGTYYIYSKYPNGLNGMYNLTSDPTGESAGFWINPNENIEATAEAYVVIKEINKYSSASNAAAQTNSTGTVAPGTYYIYNKYPNGYNGMYNLTTDPTGETADFWINPAENTEATAETYVVIKEINKYSSASSAAAQTNAAGTVAPGTYYIYNKYPDGLNGMYNLTSDPTGESAGFWINPNENIEATAATYVVKKTINKYSSASSAAAQTNATGIVSAGTYYIYNNYPDGYNGMYNLTTDPTGESAGFWINPAENETATASTYIITQDMPKYSSSTDAANQQNSTGTVAAGTYYIYKNYPTGLNGMYNLTSDPTGETAGFWINPADANVSANGTITLVRPVNKYGYATDAVNQANSTGVASVGTYYIYKNYPNGLNGMYNVSTDSTGESAGFWINPKENTTGKLNYDTMKAVWLSQFDLSGVYVSGGSQNSQSVFRYRIKQTMVAIKNSGFNTIIVQVRPNGDACYQSSYFPWSKYVVGSYGKTASYDPFKIIIEEAYAQALSVHAWVNPMRLMSTSEITSVSSSSIIRQWYNDSSKRGTYIVAVNGMYYLNPGYADVRNLIVNGVTEICQNYNVDGIHFDDYFYPLGAGNSFDQAAFTASGQANRSVWRKLCVNAFVKGTYEAVKAVDSGIIFGISPAGSIASNTGYLCADVRTWCSQAGYVDYVAPQLYWGFDHTISPFDEALAEWEALMTNSSVKLIPGLTLSKANGKTDSNDGSEWTNNKDIIKRQIQLSNTCKNFGGVIMFSLADIYNPANNSYVSTLVSERNNFEPVLKALYGG